MANLKLEHRFDPKRNRHYINDQHMVLHCHHYATLFTQLAFDAQELAQGPKVFLESSEDVFRELIQAACAASGASEPADKLDVARQVFSAMGLGKYAYASPGPAGGGVEMTHAHVDQGWLKKWGKAPHPVNLLGAAFLAAAFGTAFGKPARAYQVQETQSLALGAPKSVFKVTG